MWNAKSNDQSFLSQNAALCCSYEAVAIRSVALQAHSQQTCSDLRLRWAIGGHASGSVELLGVWEVTLSEHDDWMAISSDLQFRGVERIRILFSESPLSAASAMTVRSVVGHLSAAAQSEADPDLPSTSQAVLVDWTRRTGELMQRRLSERLRQGLQFESAEAAHRAVKAAMARAIRSASVSPSMRERRSRLGSHALQISPPV